MTTRRTNIPTPAADSPLCHSLHTEQPVLQSQRLDAVGKACSYEEHVTLPEHRARPLAGQRLSAGLQHVVDVLVQAPVQHDSWFSEVMNGLSSSLAAAT